VPLTVMFPRQDIPVTQLSVAPALGAVAHRALGRRLVELRHGGVLIIASGAIVHNLSRLCRDDRNARPEGWAESFMDAVAAAVHAGNGDALQAYHRLPGAALAVPTAEHFLPLLVAQSAADGDSPRLFAGQWRYGNLAQHCFRWG
jgi:4,5-DOPA dioxygenase extradiol